jgi:hypothetical protein
VLPAPDLNLSPRPRYGGQPEAAVTTREGGQHLQADWLLIERIDVAPNGISVTLHAAGIRSLVAELASEGAELEHDSILEAAE